LLEHAGDLEGGGVAGQQPVAEAEEEEDVAALDFEAPARTERVTLTRRLRIEAACSL
jgi:hypothetical protein